MPEAPKQLEVRWEGAEDAPVAACNLFLAQFTHAEFTLTFGYASPIFSSADDVAKVQFVRPKIVARLSMSPARLQELIDVLKKNMEMFQQAQVPEHTADKTKH